MTPYAARARTGTEWLDMARVIAMVLVVLDHVALPLADLPTRDAATPAWWLSDALFALSRLAVPLFLMISGVLLLDPRRSETLGVFYRRRLRRIGVPLVFWALAYLAFRTWYLDEPLSPRQWVRELASGEPYYHLYYLYIAVGLYTFAPFLRRLVAVVTRRELWLLCGLLFAVGVLDRLSVRVLGVGSPNAATMFVSYAGYFLLGWLLLEVELGKRVRKVAVAFVVVGLVAVVVGTWVVSVPGSFWAHSYFSDYLSPAVVAASAGAFLLMRAGGEARAGDGEWARLTPLALGVYLVHPMLLDVVRSHYGPPVGLAATAWWIFWLTTMALAGSLVIAWVLGRLPLLRRLV